MFGEKIRQSRWLLFCLLGWVFWAAPCLPAYASLPARALTSHLHAVPYCPPQTTLEMQLRDAPEPEPTLTFSFGEGRSRLQVEPGQGRSAPLEPADNNTAQMATRFQLTPASELRVSFLYNQDQNPGQVPLSPASHVLFRYSMDYCIMPHLKVGISGYLYKPTTEYFPWRGNPQLAEPLYGIGPGIKYDLGRWSFLLRTQLETGTRDRGEALHNWFRVWYAF